jgi:cardiolipin synthase A/B
MFDWFVTTSDSPRAGNRVRALVDGERAFRRICEAVDEARFSVWVTVAFLHDEFEMPDDRGSLFQLLNGAAARGIDVRIVFWRPEDDMVRWRRTTFWGSDEHRARLHAVGSGLSVRWDRSPARACQHQKSWLVDAGCDGAVGFVGGINLNPQSVVASGHSRPTLRENHDVYLEVQGPSTSDLHRNFVERWNDASERNDTDGRWGTGSAADLPVVFPESPRRGEAVAQVQRTMPPTGDLRSGSGERSILAQYEHAIARASRSIYIENQAVDVPVILQSIQAAVERGVEVVVVVPSEPEPAAEGGHLSMEVFSALAKFENFTLAGLTTSAADGGHAEIYVHSKVMLVDDEWGTVGSCNLHSWSLFKNAEMNVSFWDPAAVRELRCELFEEHLGDVTSHLDPESAHRYFGVVARRNRDLCDRASSWTGLAMQLDPAEFARLRFGEASAG